METANRRNLPLEISQSAGKRSMETANRRNLPLEILRSAGKRSMETAEAINNTVLLERFISKNYSLLAPIRNAFCIPCMEGPINKSQFKRGRQHAAHPFLQVRRYNEETDIVKIDEIKKFIDTSRLQPYYTSSGYCIAVRARHGGLRPLQPSPSLRLCEQCKDTIRSEDLKVTLCSIECSIISTQRNDHQDEAEASTRVEDASKKPKAQDLDSGKEGNETPLQEAFPANPPVTEESGRHVKVEPVGDVADRVERVPNADAPNVADGLRSEREERMWRIAYEAIVAATSERNPNSNRHDLARVLVGTYARFMLDLLPDYTQDDTPGSSTPASSTT